MKRLLLPLLVLSALLPLSSHAQSAPAPAPRFYFSGQLAYQRFNGFIEGGDLDGWGRATFFGPVLRGGWQFSPRTALEVGAGLGYHGWHLSPGNIGFEWVERWQRSATLLVPVQLSTQLLSHSSRWQLRAQTGFALVEQHVDSQLRENYPSPPAQVHPIYSAIYRDLPVLLGVAATYRFSQRWQAEAQAQAAFSLRYLFDPYGDFQAALPGGGGSVGICYSLGKSAVLPSPAVPQP
ncbi:MAG: hypothetical protein M3Y54_05805 [Bacteroidota bacterium]|nr:hypothetical protein [Bacteroidota bacterium]